MHQNKAATASPESAGGGISKCCVLCGNKVTQQLSRYSNLGVIERDFLCKHLGKYIPEESYICKKHWMKQNATIVAPTIFQNGKTFPAYKYLLNPAYIPSVSTNSVINLSNLPLLISVYSRNCLGVQSSSSTPFLLCPSCYNKVYHLFNPVQNCSFVELHQSLVKNSIVTVPTLQLFQSTLNIQLELTFLYHQITAYVLAVTIHIAVL